MSNSTTVKRGGWYVFILFVALPALACVTALGGGDSGDPAATETALAALAITDLAPTLGPAETATDTAAPEPTATTEPTATLDPGAGATSTADALAESIRAALPGFGVGPDEGQLGWIHAPVTVEVKTFKEAKYASDYPAVIVRNFVVHADVVWLTETGLAGCGFVFRANAETRDFYGMGLFRGGNGIAGFNVWRNASSEEWNRFQDAPSTNAENGATNSLAVVGRENKFTIYVNGVEVDTATHADLTAGAIGFAAFSESGTTTCAFSNGWMWNLD